MRRRVAGVLAAAALSAPAWAYTGRADPDWPCQSIKVAELSLGAVWTGPAVDAYAQSWEQDAEVAALARRVTARREPIAAAEAEIKAFAGGAPAPRLLALMAGVFEILDRERGAVVAGLDRFGRRQKELAAAIRGQSEAVGVAQASADADAAKLGALMEQLQLDTRVFDARRQEVQYACAVPATIEQRLFQLAHAIQAALPSPGR